MKSLKKLLASIGVTDVTIVGDTRFDRVLDICTVAKDLPLVKAFKGNSKTFVAGSSWGPDEDIFIRYFNEHPEMKLVIAPHVVSDSHLKEIMEKVKRPCVRYTEATAENVSKADCLIIDCYGLLSSIYRYGGNFRISVEDLELVFIMCLRQQCTAFRLFLVRTIRNSVRLSIF